MPNSIACSLQIKFDGFRASERHVYRSHVSESGGDGLATGVTGFAAPLGGGGALSVARAGLGLAAGVTVAGARTIGFADVAASG